MISILLMSDRSHCDGDCDGSIHRSTGRVATAVLYCKVQSHLSTLTSLRCVDS